mmetsp:Transcript_5181/g.21327  ORF Transcript_5181/g.21327 Transcript_5181/m.21327 type:complete len:753 (-) Transcript_5181:402-2660(-)
MSVEDAAPGSTPPAAAAATTPARHHHHVPAADGGLDEELKEEAEEDARVNELLESAEKESAVEAVEAPVLLQAANDGHEVQRASSAEAKQEQLITLLNKAQQYSQFIVNSQSDSLAATAQSKAPRTNGEAKAASDGNPKSKKRKLDDASASPTSLSEGFVDAAKRSSDGQSKSRLVEQPKTMIGGTLKGYQVEGLRWMATLYENGLSGILADEMGLGKTLQTISLLAYLAEARDTTGPHICIVPKSVVNNWIREFKKWCPTTRTVKLLGSKDERARIIRDDMADTSSFDVCVTSYEGVLKEKGALCKIDWEYLVIDEAHRIKNPKSSLSKVVRLIPTKFRLLITGTPLQNNLNELWALLNFLLPDIFASETDFESWFSIEADDDAKENVVKKLHTVLRPFMLRRIKKDVEKDLPPKREVKLYIGLTEMQRLWYTKILSKDAHTLNALGGPDRVQLLNILMQLRKVCNHPYLFEGAEPGPPYVDGPHLWDNAGKLVLLTKLLPKLKAQSSRVLVFSQMTRMLDILEDYMRLNGHEYCRIDGSTHGDDRDAQMDEFNAPGSPKFVFLLSTRAGGLGINLAAADTCIIFDSDWNPQQDSQAMDRCHRIGQKRPVVVYRLLTAGSVEISMIEKQLSKKKLERMAITGGDFKRAGQRSTGRDFSVDHLRELLADDVDLAQRVGGSGDKSNGEENGETSTHAAETPSKPVDRISDAELDLILDRRRIFDKDDPIPLEGDHYDVVVDAVTDGGILGKVQ